MRDSESVPTSLANLDCLKIICRQKFVAFPKAKFVIEILNEIHFYVLFVISSVPTRHAILSRCTKTAQQILYNERKFIRLFVQSRADGKSETRHLNVKNYPIHTKARRTEKGFFHRSSHIEEEKQLPKNYIHRQ